jgi:hypothetical protein
MFANRQGDSMTSDSGDGTPRWLVEPPAPNTINFQIVAGDRVEMTSEIRTAFERLLEAMSGGDDVQGFQDKCHSFEKGCTTNTFTCVPRRVCTVESQFPCFVDYGCSIAPPP